MTVLVWFSALKLDLNVSLALVEKHLRGMSRRGVGELVSSKTGSANTAVYIRPGVHPNLLVDKGDSR